MRWAALRVRTRPNISRLSKLIVGYRKSSRTGFPFLISKWIATFQKSRANSSKSQVLRVAHLLKENVLAVFHSVAGRLFVPATGQRFERYHIYFALQFSRFLHTLPLHPRVVMSLRMEIPNDQTVRDNHFVPDHVCWASSVPGADSSGNYVPRRAAPSFDGSRGKSRADEYAWRENVVGRPAIQGKTSTQ